jgi:hypothetical protein
MSVVEFVLMQLYRGRRLGGVGPHGSRASASEQSDFEQSDSFAGLVDAIAVALELTKVPQVVLELVLADVICEIVFDCLRRKVPMPSLVRCGVYVHIFCGEKIDGQSANSEKWGYRRVGRIYNCCARTWKRLLE